MDIVDIQGQFYVFVAHQPSNTSFGVSTIYHFEGINLILTSVPCAGIKILHQQLIYKTCD